MRDTTLFNYALDVAPRVRFTVRGVTDYAPLAGATVFGPHESGADVKVDIACNHHILEHIAMLDFAYAASLAPADALERIYCVLGPRGWSLNDDLASARTFLLAPLASQTAVRMFANRFPASKP